MIIHGITPVNTYFNISIGTVPKYSIINFNTEEPSIDNDFYNILAIHIKNNIGMTDLLSGTQTRINYYCNRLYSVIKKSWHTSTNNKPYSYKDLTNITNTSKLASAILQYTYGNSYRIDDEKIYTER